MTPLGKGWNGSQLEGKGTQGSEEQARGQMMLFDKLDLAVSEISP